MGEGELQDLNDCASRREEILRFAKNTAEAGTKLTSSELVRRLLLSPSEAEKYRPVSIKAGHKQRQAVWQLKENGSVQITVRSIPEELSAKDRKALLKEISSRLGDYLDRI